LPQLQSSYHRKSIDGAPAELFKVTFPDAEKTILILDHNYNLEGEIAPLTMKNMCYQVCAALHSSHTFLYFSTRSMEKEHIQALIDKVKPDGILFAHDAPLKKLGLEVIDYFGFVRAFQGIPAVLSTPFHKWTRGEGFAKGEGGKNLIGFNLKHLTYVTEGKNPFTAGKPRDMNFPIRIIKTIDQFKIFYKQLCEQRVVGNDVEGKNLSRIDNTLFTIQFGFQTKKGYISYVLPWKQKDHVWKDKELAYIKKKLREWYLTTKAEIVYHYGQFDVGQISQALDLPFFPAKVYDTISGEFAMDENHKYIKNIYQIPQFKKGYQPYSLEAVEPRYGIVRKKTTIGKEDRSNMAQYSLEDLAQYGGIDAITILMIRSFQIEQCTHRWVGYRRVAHFKKVVIHQLGIMVKTFSMLMDTGIHIDLDNARHLLEPGEVFDKAVNGIRDQILATPEGQKANKILMKKQGLNPTTSMFSTKVPAVLSLTKPSHLRTLFYDVAKLEPIKTGKTGDPSTDKGFQKAYKDVPIVKMYGKFNKAKTLKGNFAVAIIKFSKTVHDFKMDGRLRPSFGFTSVLTGRLGVNKPNSQNIPTRFDKSDPIEEAMVKGVKGSFSVKFPRVMMGSDFSAHEVRVGGILSNDPVVSNTFKTANEAIRKYRLSPKELLEKAAEVLAREGDIHIQNVKHFFGKTVDKKHVLRDQIKTVVFGVLYGKMAKSLARELGIEEEEAKALIDAMFDKWNVMATWIDEVHETSKKTFMFHYPNFRIRHLWAYANDDIWVERAMDRRSVNSPIQGFASDIGITSIYCYKLWVYRHITKNGYEFDSHHTNVVHDASYTDNKYEHVPFAVYLLEHSMSSLPMKYYKDKFGFTMNTPLGYGLEIGESWAKMKDWNFRIDDLCDILQAEGKRVNIKSDGVVADARYIWKNLRRPELESDPYVITASNRMPELFKNLNMFRSQHA
jgi:hypothetical protein